MFHMSHFICTWSRWSWAISYVYVSYEPFQNSGVYPTWSWVASFCKPLDNIMTLTGFASIMYDSMQRVQHSTPLVKKQADFIEPKYRFVAVKHTTTKGARKPTILRSKIPISQSCAWNHIPRGDVWLNTFECQKLISMSIWTWSWPMWYRHMTIFFQKTISSCQTRQHPTVAMDPIYDHTCSKNTCKTPVCTTFADSLKKSVHPGWRARIQGYTTLFIMMESHMHG
jgi:hypothetical protein